MAWLAFAQQMPSTFWEKALDQVPGLAVVCVGGIFIVAAFLRAIRKQTEDNKAIVAALTTDNKTTVDRFLLHITANEERQAKRDTDHDAALTKINDENHVVQKDVAAQNAGAFAKVASALDRNTEALGLNSAALATASRAAAQHTDLVAVFHEYRREAAVYHKENVDLHKETRHALANWQHAEKMREAAEEALRRVAETKHPEGSS